VLSEVTGFPDPESLLRRSPASAPLLDAVKDRKTRDAVRSVLERFTAGGAKPGGSTAPEWRGGGGSGEVGVRVGLCRANWRESVNRSSSAPITSPMEALHLR
jgi:hypothetical protein